MQPSRIQRHQRMHKTVRASQQCIQLVHLFRGRSGFRAQPVDRRFQVRAGHARSQPHTIELTCAAGFVPHVGFRQRMKIFPVRIEHCGDPVENLRAFPGRPDPIREKRQRASCCCVDSARPDNFFWRDSRDGDQKNHERADGHCENPIVGRTDPAQQQRKHKYQYNLHCGAVGEKAKERRGQKKAQDRSANPQKTAAESGRKFRLQHQHNCHRQPIRTMPVEGALQAVPESDHRRQAYRMPHRGRLQIQVCAQRRQQPAEAE